MVRCVWYHVLVVGTALLSGVMLVGLGIFLKVRDPLQNLELAFTEDSSINKFLGVDYISIFVGFVLVIVAITGVFVAKKWPGRPLVVAVYTVILFGMMAALIFVSVFTLSLANGNVLFEIDTKLERAWENTVKIAKDEACEIQKDFDCFGFRDQQCIGCARINGTDSVCTAEKRAVCPSCKDMPKRTSAGCYGALMNRTRSLYGPTGIASAGVAGLLLVDCFVVPTGRTKATSLAARTVFGAPLLWRSVKNLEGNVFMPADVNYSRREFV